MKLLSETIKTADWKNEKHVPVIDAPLAVQKGSIVAVAITLGKEVAHPNTTAHHISWIALYFQPEGSPAPYEVGRVEFKAHGASPEGADRSGVYTHHEAVMKLKTDVSGTLLATSYCNIHGLWQSAQVLAVE